MTATMTTTKEVSTHGTMSIQFAVNGMTSEEFALKFSDTITEQMNIAMKSLTGESVELEIFGHDINQLETFVDDEF
ncbi:hypothetical protein [Planococcus halocryophilus]|uniref:hypothetical protein n=1 Tax=Planococcus halocryophilus TaxID=1215089 RepID=UPI001F0FACCB|nr:hypothetical protein [Planococcus halocryophilus]MCH4825773.1 hypothetical protein [Planococcus halocryophilus]